MNDEQRFARSITASMRDGRALVLKHGDVVLPMRVVIVKTSNRPDGLRDDLTIDPGFVVAASEATLEIDATKLSSKELEVVHEVLTEAARDFDWIGYSHNGEPIEGQPTLTLFFSSAAKGAGVLVQLLEALSVPASEVTLS